MVLEYTLSPFVFIRLFSVGWIQSRSIFSPAPSPMPDVRVKPRCGCLVGFSASQENLHRVMGVTKGRRCAIALWFTLDPGHKEHTFDTAETLLTARSS